MGTGNESQGLIAEYLGRHFSIGLARDREPTLTVEFSIGDLDMQSRSVGNREGSERGACIEYLSAPNLFAYRLVIIVSVLSTQIGFTTRQRNSAQCDGGLNQVLLGERPERASTFNSRLWI
jgi:hypothetical protein